MISFILVACVMEPNESLLKAASNGDVAEIEAALSKGANINFADEKGNDALIISAMQDKPESVRILLKRGAKITCTNTVLSAPEVAALMGHNEVLSVFFESGFPATWQGPNGRTLLHAAAEGQEKIVRLLLDKGVPVDGYKRDIDTPLFQAVGTNDAEIVKMLLTAGADPNFKNKYGNCPLTLALTEHRDDIAKNLAAYGAKECRQLK